MYPDQLKFALDAIAALDALDAEQDAQKQSNFYLGPIPVKFDGDTIAELRDEIGGAWSYHPNGAF